MRTIKELVRNHNLHHKNMKTIKELKQEANKDSEEFGYLYALEDVLGLIDEWAKGMSGDKVCAEELKARIIG